jgi:sulfite reductase alpha subunit-like flavoprotein
MFYCIIGSFPLCSFLFQHLLTLPTDGTPAILVAAGTGLAPFMGLLEERCPTLSI